ncbi:MAG: response regulator transcription factor [Pirellulaceae bacterium]|jgi:DNA-binding NarL/FixJ family response regulator|nr:response regulator transcription factor [Pirellulaceae bacterium]
MPKCKILVVDDHPIVRKGLAQLISQEPDIELCGDADNVTQALEQIAARHPDLVVVDMALKDSHGLELLAEIRSRFPDVRTLVWSMFDEKVYAERAIRAGAMGYVNKQESTQQLMDAIRLVLNGELYVSSQMTRALLRRVSGSTLLEQDPIQTLSNRELEVFEMIGNAMTTQQIARKLNLSPKTVEAHREKIKAKLNLANAAELSRRAVQWVLEGS